MQIVEAFVVEEFVDRERHGVTNAQHGPEGIGTRTQMGDLAQEFERMSLLLERIGFGVGLAVHLQFTRLHLDTLPGADRLDEHAAGTDAGPGGDAFQQFAVESGHVDYDLDIVDRGTVVEGDERHILVSPFGTDPSLYDHLGIYPAGAQQLRYHRPFHFRHCVHTLFVVTL